MKITAWASRNPYIAGFLQREMLYTGVVKSRLRIVQTLLIKPMVMKMMPNQIFKKEALVWSLVLSVPPTRQDIQLG